MQKAHLQNIARRKTMLLDVDAMDRYKHIPRKNILTENINVVENIYYTPINDTSFELSVFWPSDTENRINELRFF